MIDKNIFRAYDIRGRAMGEDVNITNETAYLLGRGAAAMLLEKGMDQMVLGKKTQGMKLLTAIHS